MSERSSSPRWVSALARLLPKRYRAEIVGDLLDEREGMIASGRSSPAASAWLAAHIIRSAVASRQGRGSDGGQTRVRPGSDQGQTGVRPGSDECERRGLLVGAGDGDLAAVGGMRDAYEPGITTDLAILHEAAVDVLFDEDFDLFAAIGANDDELFLVGHTF